MLYVHSTHVARARTHTHKPATYLLKLEERYRNASTQSDSLYTFTSRYPHTA